MPAFGGRNQTIKLSFLKYVETVQLHRALSVICNRSQRMKADRVRASPIVAPHPGVVVPSSRDKKTSGPDAAPLISVQCVPSKTSPLGGDAARQAGTGPRAGSLQRRLTLSLSAHSALGHSARCRLTCDDTVLDWLTFTIVTVAVAALGVGEHHLPPEAFTVSSSPSTVVSVSCRR